MLSSPKHVFFTTREGVDYKMENGELVVVGQKMRAEKKLSTNLQLLSE